MSSPPDSELRLRYLDWCSARVAQRFLQLTPDEVWLRARQADSLPHSDERSVGADALPASSSVPDGSPEYLDLVRRTALVLARELRLPEFAEWREAYLRDPDAYQQELLGVPRDPAQNSAV